MLITLSILAIFGSALLLTGFMSFTKRPAILYMFTVIWGCQLWAAYLYWCGK